MWSLDHLGNMGGDHGLRINNGIATEHGFFLHALFDPHGRQVEGRFHGFFTGKGDFLAARIHDQQHVGAKVATACLDFLDAQYIGVGGKLHIVLNTHTGHDKAHIGGKLPT